ncbi:unnamed protein product [Nesidiocoris tenuis]|uniref:Uncharacterized protein n=1 Tax=Nesidiocoris tenuis TaxID=355587 RepID=A0A6H5H766_9HEMI|nr:unnamed protein product [Nesidiocoris tenuis]
MSRSALFVYENYGNSFPSGRPTSILEEERASLHSRAPLFSVFSQNFYSPSMRTIAIPHVDFSFYFSFPAQEKRGASLLELVIMGFSFLTVAFPFGGTREVLSPQFDYGGQALFGPVSEQVYGLKRNSLGHPVYLKTPAVNHKILKIRLHKFTVAEEKPTVTVFYHFPKSHTYTYYQSPSVCWPQLFRLIFEEQGRGGLRVMEEPRTWGSPSLPTPFRTLDNSFLRFASDGVRHSGA